MSPTQHNLRTAVPLWESATCLLASHANCRHAADVFIACTKHGCAVNGNVSVDSATVPTRCTEWDPMDATKIEQYSSVITVTSLHDGEIQGSIIGGHGRGPHRVSYPMSTLDSLLWGIDVGAGNLTAHLRLCRNRRKTGARPPFFYRTRLGAPCTKLPVSSVNKIILHWSHILRTCLLRRELTDFSVCGLSTNWLGSDSRQEQIFCACTGWLWDLSALATTQYRRLFLWRKLISA
jgi:hypothetical protein